MSIPGSWSRLSRTNVSLHFCEDRGFTLIELTVVIVLISIVFFIAIPRFQNDIFTDPTQKTSRWLLANVRDMKERSFREKKDYILYVDTDNHAIWISERTKDDAVDASDAFEEKTKANQYQLPENLRVLDVELPGDVQITTGVAEIVFYARGYSDSAYIHMEEADKDRRLSFFIEPFLPEVRFFETYVGFES